MSKIIKGILNHIFKDEEITELAEERLMVCLSKDAPYDNCRNYNPNGILGPKCDACGCVLQFKSKSPKARCPINKWKR